MINGHRTPTLPNCQPRAKRLVRSVPTVGHSLLRLRRDNQGLALPGYGLGSVVILVPIVIAMFLFGNATAERASSDMAGLANAAQQDSLSHSGSSAAEVELTANLPTGNASTEANTVKVSDVGSDPIVCPLAPGGLVQGDEATSGNVTNCADGNSPFDG